ncbi:MAG: DUF3782 domain-containing protein [Methylococcales bacterium]|nr:DUF3782 domain-containing protein [Methylococcales bacterium]
MPSITSPAPTLDDILRLFQETDRMIKESQKETDRKFQETALAIKAVNTSIGKLGNRLGEFVEDAVRPSAVRLFRECGIDVHEVQQNIVAKRNGESLELDLLVVNDKDAVAIECKSHLSIDDINEHLLRLEKMKRLLPRYKDNRVLGAVAGMGIPENVALYAMRKGLYVIGQNGDHLELRNESVFVPKAW